VSDSISNKRSLTISTPGRICLFGEHQDYLGLPIIAAAISLRLRIHGKKRLDNKININLPDIQSIESFENTSNPFVYTKKADYFRSCMNVLKNNGFIFPTGFECEVNGEIPIKSGTSSSSALVVSWINFLSKMCANPKQLTQEEIGKLAYGAEVLEFNEAGGMMDQYTTAIGNTIFLSSTPSINIERLPADFGTFVLGDSLTQKDTQNILTTVGNNQREVLKKVKKMDDNFNIHDNSSIAILEYKNDLKPEEYELLYGIIRNREITYQARSLLSKKEIDHKKFGALLTELQHILNKILQISTPKIENMISSALAAGAYGAKINGSGGGGCMFAYAPENPDSVAKAIENAGGISYIIRIDEGTKIEFYNE
jgi:galactokinase